MRKFYSGLFYLLLPFITLYLKKRGQKNSAYLENWSERFGLKLVNPTEKPIIWFHSVSVGETRAIQSLIELFHVNYPNYQILITSMTPTGRDTAKNLYPYVIVHYIPYDLPHAMVNFYKTFKPTLGIILETEIWPNLIFYAHKFNIPLYLVNARLSNHSYNGYKWFKWFLTPTLKLFNGIFCQDGNSANNFEKLGYSTSLKTIGNIKFDISINSEIDSKFNELKNIFPNKKIITFASTREGEEELILDNIDFDLDVIYLIIPRHPERFVVLENLLNKKNIVYQKRSSNTAILPQVKMIIGDSMGEMLAYYAISYLVVIGGSFKSHGGQNPIEAIYMNKPVIFGPYMFNFKQVANDILNTHCGIQVKKLNQAIDVVYNLVSSDISYTKLTANCALFIDNHKGASQKNFDLLKSHLV